MAPERNENRFPTLWMLSDFRLGQGDFVEPELDVALKAYASVAFEDPEMLEIIMMAEYSSYYASFATEGQRN